MLLPSSSSLSVWRSSIVALGTLLVALELFRQKAVLFVLALQVVALQGVNERFCFHNTARGMRTKTNLKKSTHGCKIWLFVREALQFPWILQQNLDAAARSGPKGSFSRCSSRKKRRLQRLQCENECEVEVVKVSFFSFFLFFLEKRTFSANEDLFE